MKTLNWKVAILTFTAFAILDAVLLTFSFLPAFHGTLVSVVWWVLNAPGMLLAIGFQHYMQLPESSFAFLTISAGVFSTLIWSVVGGYMFYHKQVA